MGFDLVLFSLPPFRSADSAIAPWSARHNYARGVKKTIRLLVLPTYAVFRRTCKRALTHLK
jgi:hypothetical protein